MLPSVVEGWCDDTRARDPRGPCEPAPSSHRTGTKPQVRARQCLPARAPVAGRRAFSNHRPTATRLLADVCEDGRPPRRLRWLVCPAGIRGPNVVAGRASGHAAGVSRGRDRVQYSARRRPSSLFKPPLGQQAHGNDVGVDWRQLLPVALEARRTPSYIRQYHRP